MAEVQKSYRSKCSEKHISEAKRRAKIRIESEYKRDIRLNTEQRIEKIAIGYFGEFVFLDWCKLKNIKIKYLGEEIGNKPDNGDFISENNKIIDVKTQEVFYLPQNDWRCEVTDEQKNRPADIYVFAKLFSKENIKILYLVGWLDKKEFFEKSTFRKPGTILKGKPVHYPKWDITISELNEIENLVNVLKQK